MSRARNWRECGLPNRLNSLTQTFTLTDGVARTNDLAVSTDLIVGFPGETDDEFAATLEVVAEARYDSAYMFIYSPREGTAAAEMTDRFIDPAVVSERFSRLQVVVERSAVARLRERVGRIEEVLGEGPSRRGPDSTSCRTPPAKVGHFPSPPRPSLRGELREVIRRPPRRGRIPVVAA